MFKKHKKHRKQSLVMRIVAVGLVFGFFGTGLLLLWAASLQVPDLQSFEQRKVKQSTKIYDKTGDVLLYDIHENIQRTVTPLIDISRHIKNATVAIEDAAFYDHIGIRPLATFRAVFIQPLRGKGIQGGSTITQQVIKNSVLTSEKKVSRKLKEWILAIKLEQDLSKEKILELYLNESPYGGNIYGVEEASDAFFNKPASEITLAEAAYIAALPQAPTYYSPYGNNLDKLEKRKNLVLLKMLEHNFITEDEYLNAVETTIVFEPQQDLGIKAPHFVFFIREYLESTYGKRAVEEKGFKVITTLDWELQKKAEEIVKKFALENEEKFNAENAGLVAIDSKTGQIITMVGSRDYFDKNIDGNFNIALAYRQPGSAFKPFVYATAFKKGYTPDTIVFDVQTQFQSDCEPDNFTNESDDENNESGCYSPKNYDNVFRGPVTLRDALAQSINVPAIKTLYLAGLTDSLRTAKDIGIQTLTDINQYGLTLVLGGGEVTLLDITGAYSVFSNEGVRNKPTGILRIEDGDGNLVELFEQQSERVIDRNIARQISDILSDNDARAPAFSYSSPLHFPGYDVAAKTGTTNDYRDAWTVGYTPNIAVGAWAGNNDNSSMEKRVAGFIITPLWNTFMKEVLAVYPEERFKKPTKQPENELKPIFKGIWRGGETYMIDSISKNLATKYTPIELQQEEVITDVHSILYWVNKLEPQGQRPEFPSRDTQFIFWETGVQEWLKKNPVASTTIPTAYDTIHKPEFIPKLKIITPVKNITYDATKRISIFINTTSTFSISKVDFFINGVFIGSANQKPFSISLIPSDIEYISTKNTLKAIGYDIYKNKGEVETVFNVNL